MKLPHKTEHHRLDDVTVTVERIFDQIFVSITTILTNIQHLIWISKPFITAKINKLQTTLFSKQLHQIYTIRLEGEDLLSALPNQTKTHELIHFHTR